MRPERDRLEALRAMADPADERVVVICVRWGEQSVPSVAAECFACGKALAMSRRLRKDQPAALAACAQCGHEAQPDATPSILPVTRMEVTARTGVDPGLEPGISLADFIRRTRP